MAHVYYHCNGVGPIIKQATIDMPYYEHGISMFAWAPPHDMDEKEIDKVDEKLEHLRQKQLEIIAEATGGEITGDPARNESW